MSSSDTPDPSAPPQTDDATPNAGPLFRRTWAIIAMVAVAFAAGTQVGGGSEPDPEAETAASQNEPATTDTSDESAEEEEEVEEPDLQQLATDVCGRINGADDVGPALLRVDVDSSQIRALRLAVEEQCPEKAKAPTYVEPEAEDFELTVNTLEQSCFGSAGCNVTFRVTLGYGGGPLDPDQVYELTYEVQGGEDPMIRTMEIQGDSYTHNEQDRISTPSSDAELVAVVTKIAARG